MSKKAIDILKGFREDMLRQYKDEVLSDAIIKLITQAVDELEAPWISVDDRLPENSEEVLVFAPDRNIIGNKLIGRFYQDSNSWTVYCFRDSIIDEKVTHWMPLPNNPKP